MKVKITHPIPEHSLFAGLIYDLPEEVAREIIEKDLGFATDVETIDVTALTDKKHIEAPKRKAKK